MTAILKQTNTALVVVDIQEAFRKSIVVLDDIIRAASVAVRGFELLDCPVLFTEQYPKGLGPTVKELIDCSNDFIVFEKSGFSSCTGTGFLEHLRKEKIENVVIAGIETHVCVNQTVHDLLTMGLSVHILEDAVASRNSADRKTALKKMYLNGARPSTVEMALFELMADSKHAQFKQIQALVK